MSGTEMEESAELRASVAASMRELAQSATRGPWFREYGDVITSADDPRDVEEGYDEPRKMRVVRRAPHLDQGDPQGIANANHVVSWSPDVALAVADLVACPCEKHANIVAGVYTSRGLFR